MSGARDQWWRFGWHLKVSNDRIIPPNVIANS
jgi:hypothetical protein